VSNSRKQGWMMTGWVMFLRLVERRQRVCRML
jgi:hypothetical protein